MNLDNQKLLINLVDTLLFQNIKKHLTDVQAAIIKGALQEKSYLETSQDNGYTEQYIKEEGSKFWRLLSKVLGEKVTKVNFRAALERRLESEKVAPITVDLQSLQSTIPAIEPHQDWGEAPDIPLIYGRNNELATLEQLLIKEKCRLIALLGMGGIGKTTLALRICQATQQNFQYVIWRSLRESPPIEKIVTDLIKFLSHQPEVQIPETLGEKITQLINYLRNSRCLIILDNFESILESGTSNSDYRQGYQGYGDLIKRIGESKHQSCLIITSRETPQEVVQLSGKNRPVRSLRLSGLAQLEAQKIFQEHGIFSASTEEWQTLINHYAGNPLALNMVASAIEECLDGNVSRFVSQYLNKERALFDDIRELLNQQFERLTSAEKEIMHWLAINREPVTDWQLEKDIISPVTQQELLPALRSLMRRSLIEKVNDGFTLQNVVMEYTTKRLVEKINQEITTEEVKFFISHALMKATAKDYIRDTQIRLILKPLLERLVANLGNLARVQEKLKRVVSCLQKHPQPGYATGNTLNLLIQQKVDLSNYDFSNLTVWQAFLQNTNLKGVNFSKCDLTNSVFSQRLNGIMSLTYSPNGQLLATGDIESDICLWRVADGQLLSIYKGHSNWIKSLAFSPDGKLIASGGMDALIKLTEIPTGKCLRTITEHSNMIGTVTFSPDGEILASSSGDRTIRLWNVKTGECLSILQGHTHWVAAIAFSPDGEILVSGCDDYTIKVWQVNTGECWATWSGHTAPIRSIAYHPHGKIIASASQDGIIKLWQITTGKCLTTLTAHSDEIWSINFSPNGETLASCSSDKYVKLWQVDKLGNIECKQALLGHQDIVWQVAFSPDGQTLASGSNDKTVQFWDVRTGQRLNILKGYLSWVESLSFSPDGQTLASGNGDGSVRFWNINNYECEKTWWGHKNLVWTVTFSNDGQYFASGSTDYTIRVWQVGTDECLVLTGHIGWVRKVLFSLDNKTLISSSHDQTIKFWDLVTGQCIKSLNGHAGWIFSIALSPDGKMLVSGSGDGTIKLWDVDSGKCIKTLTGHTDWVWSVAFSPDGKTVVSGSSDRTIKVWCVATGECLITLLGHQDWVGSINFSMDGKRLVSGSRDGTIKLWDMQSGVCQLTLQGHENGVESVIFNPNGNLLASGSMDETIKLWDVATGACVHTLRSPRLYEGMNITGITGLSDAQKETLKINGAVEMEIAS
jgi:WD40 repeat protein